MFEGMKKEGLKKYWNKNKKKVDIVKEKTKEHI